MALQTAAAVSALPNNDRVVDFSTALRLLEDKNAMSRETAQIFHHLRQVGNRAAHENAGSRGDALHALRLPVTTFASSPTTIDWPHVLQWLTRDQESRFSGLAELRHSSSESHAPDMMAEDRHIFRMARTLEQSFNEQPFSFQYIITTTESPPEEFQQAPWLLQPVLDASEPGGKLLGENF